MPTLLSIESLEADREYVERQLMEAGDDAWGTARHMWETRLAEIDAQMAALSASRSNYASVALVFEGNPVIGAGDIRLDFATEVLDSYQRIISLALAAKLSPGDLPERGRLPSVEKSRLFIRDLVRGSMGFILEEIPADQHELLPTPLKDAVEGTTQLLRTLSEASDGEFETALQQTQPRVLAAIQKFAKVLSEAGASTKILGDDRRLSLTMTDVGRLSSRLSEVEIVEAVEAVDGTLLGVLPESHEFELKPLGDNPITIKGSISDEIALKYTADAAFKETLLLRPIRARIRFLRTTRNGRLLSEKRILETVEAPQSSSRQLIGT
jgi:hypothetical protein